MWPLKLATEQVAPPQAVLWKMLLMHQEMLHIEKAVQELKLKMKGELHLRSKEQIALYEDDKMTIGGFDDRYIDLENMINQLDKLWFISHSEPEERKLFPKTLGTLQYDAKELRQARNEIETKVDIRYTRVANRFGRVELTQLLCQGMFSSPTA